MATSFMRAPAPDLMVTADLAALKCMATKPISSALALPSTGGDLRLARNVPSSSELKLLSRALGLTLTCMTFTNYLGALAADLGSDHKLGKHGRR
jgi:hypothetical protein